MSYQPRSTNPYIMEKKLNECVGGGGIDPSVLEEIQAEISVLGSENATMTQDIIDIKGSLNSINDKLTWTISSPISDTLEHDLPSSFSEMIIKANLGSYVIMTIHVLRDMLQTVSENYRVGYSGTQGISAYVSFSITDTKIKFQNGALNGTALTSVSYRYWYR